MKYLVISNSRADVNPLTPVADALKARWMFMHLARTPQSREEAATSCGEVVSVAAMRLKAEAPDAVILLGDRFETLATAIAAHLLNIPIVHLSGGDVTEGSQDDAMRNAITKLAHIHFATTQEAADRIIAMGEEPWRVHAVGCPGVDFLQKVETYNRADTLKRLYSTDPFFLVNYHPATLLDNPLQEADELLTALGQFLTPCIFATVNKDAYGKQIEQKIINHCLEHTANILEMDAKLYFSAMKYCSVMIGNSSSGFYEAPSFGTPFVNVGARQKGRIPPHNVVDGGITAASIQAGIQFAIRQPPLKRENPYGDGHAAVRIKNILEGLGSDRQALLVKQVAPYVPWPETRPVMPLQ